MEIKNKWGLDEGSEIWKNLMNLKEKVLDRVEQISGLKITVTSSYRDEETNRKCGGKPNSQHLKGEAADIKSADNARIFNIIKTLEFDQLIWEGGDKEQPAWIHVSLKRDGGNRKQILMIPYVKTYG